MKIGRNDACPCGSGKKAKRCHPETVGLTTEGYVARSNGLAWVSEHLTFLEGCEGYMAPMNADERSAWKRTGCPHGSCNNETETGCAAPDCGV